MWNSLSDSDPVKTSCVRYCKLKLALVCLTVVSLSVMAGWGAHDLFHRYYDRSANRKIILKGFRFTSPLLDVELPEGMKDRYAPIPFKKKIEEYIQAQVKAGTVRNVSVYYRDLGDGSWFGINETREFNAASMMKVSVMVAWLKRAEKNPQLLGQKFVYDGKINYASMQSIKPLKTIVAGKPYTVDELLHYMLNYSDNNATYLLFNELQPDELNSVLDGMDISNHMYDGGNYLTVHGYSGFFRILYNASFLNHEMSEKALQLLSLQDFPQGIVAGVPKGTVVAAKFGEYELGSQNVDGQLHEFGIIYHPKGAYILGIMTEGRDAARQAEVIRTVSSIIYAEVDAVTSR